MIPRVQNRFPRTGALTRLLLAGLLASAAPAHADGDPASDFLLSQRVFVPFDAKIPQPLATQLDGLLLRAKKSGYEIRVALIATRYDMGSVTALMGKPRQYARFLGQELAFVYKGRLLIVMPNGFGFSQPGHDTSTEERLLQRLPVQPGSDGLTRSPITAVQRLAAASGVNVRPPPLKPAADHANHDRLIIIVASISALVLLFAARLALLARRRRHA